MDGFFLKLSSEYNLEITGIIPSRDIQLLSTASGRYVLKKLDTSIERIHFVHQFKKHIEEKGFPETDMYLETTDGLPYIKNEEETYVLRKNIEGRESSFDKLEDACDAASLLALLHKCSKGYFLNSPEEYCKLPTYSLKRIEDIKKLQKSARKGNSEFDRLYLKYSGRFIENGMNALKELLDTGYDSLYDIVLQEGYMCHHDYTHQNIIHGKDKVHVINFEYISREIKEYDIANFLRRIMRKTGWNSNHAVKLLESYDKVFKLDNYNIKIICAILSIPQKFWRIANKYYNSKRTIAERNLLQKLEETIDELAPSENFINKLLSS